MALGLDKKKLFAHTLKILLVGCLVLLFSDNSPAIVDSKTENEIYMIKGDLETIKVYDLTRISITHPAIADIANVDTEHILMLAKKPGQTTLFLWDQYGKRSVIIRVFDEDLSLVKARLERLFAEANIKNIGLEINQLEGKVVVSGDVPEDQKGDFNKLLEPFSASVMNLVKEQKEEDLIQIDAQISELNSSYSKNLGFDWTSALSYDETLPAFGKYDYFKVGDFKRTTKIIAAVNALITEGKGRVLSKPKLVCVSGKEARFLVGGQIPITTTTTSSGGNVQQNVQFRDYGITLTVKPTIRNEKIDIDLNIEVSDIDASNAVGQNVAFTTRNAQTQLYLENRQTVVLAGLIKSYQNQTVKRIPFLSDIPLVGAIFRSKKNVTPSTDTELIISLTPTILTLQGIKASVDRIDILARDDKAKASAETPTEGPLIQEESSLAKDGKATKMDEKYTPASKPPVPSSAPAAREQPEAATALATSQTPTTAEATEASGAESILAYTQTIQERITQNSVYPDEAREKGLEGTVKLALYILNDGTLAHVSVKQSSGYEIFDNDALNTAKNLAPYSGFPSDSNLRELTVTIPIVYSLSSNSQ